MTLVWLDSSSAAVRSAVVSGGWGRTPHTDHGNPLPAAGAIDPIHTALARASDILFRMTGGAIHPAGTAVEHFQVMNYTRKFRLQVRPVRLVEGVWRRLDDASLEPVTDGWIAWASNLEMTSNRTLALAGTQTYSLISTVCSQFELRNYEVRYRFGSTITEAARAAVLSLAHQYWLASSGCDECDTCVLPENVTGVTRDGITYSMDTPTPGTGGYDRVGLTEVDRWISTVNKVQAHAPSGIYAPDAIPGVIVSLVDARPTWAS